MAWTCYILEFSSSFLKWRLPGTNEYNMVWADLQPGAMWFEDGELSVKLPGGGEWNIDRGRLWNEQIGREGKKPLPAWTRTGEAPFITASPSINWVGKYHGWLQNGILTDDCEGRKF